MSKEQEKCEHKYIENNMCPDTCRDCGAVLKDGTNEPINQELLKEELNWEEEFDEMFVNKDETVDYINHSANPIKNFIQSLLKEREDKAYFKGFDEGGKTKGGTGRIMYERGHEEGFKLGLKKEFPLGVSQWKNHGEKYGYEKYFEDKVRQEIVLEIYGMKKDEYTEMSKGVMCAVKGATGYNEAIDDIINLINNK